MTIKTTINFLILITLSACSLAPGMHMQTNTNWFSNQQSVYIESIDKNIIVTSINDYSDNNKEKNFIYKIGIGDQIAVTIWGLPDVFPIINVTPDQNLRRVDPNGNIFFPYAGLIKAENKTQDELRNDLTVALSEYFTDPQVDVTISRFNSQQIFVLGEVTKPVKINITDRPISLSDAIGNSFGLNTNTSGPRCFYY